MRRRLAALFGAPSLIAALFAGTPAAMAQERAGPGAEDVSCVALFAIKGKAAAAQQQPVDVYLVGSYYFVGKIRAQYPDADLTAPLAAAIVDLEGMSVEQELERCLSEVTRQGGILREAFGGAQRQVAGE